MSTNNHRSSKRVASKASSALRRKNGSSNTKSIAGSALGNRKK